MNDAIYPLTLYYESACQLCNAEMANLKLRDSKGLLRFVDVSATGFDACPPGTTLDDLLALIHGQTAHGRVLKGVEVFRLAYSAVGIPQVAALTRLPGIAPLSERAYALIARNRHRLPRRLITAVFEHSLRRAAQQAAARRCDGNTCTAGPVVPDNAPRSTR
ncbi:thiol-disulfide oxidoreductase DCC family protein [Burkholderiaceae bacterium UC74_6]